MVSVHNSITEAALRNYLQKLNYATSSQRLNGQTGVDIIATRLNREYYIEVIGYKNQGSGRSKDFYEVVFRTMSRLNDGAKKCVVALPIEFKMGFQQRMDNIKDFMRRFIIAFPEFRIWFVDTQNNNVEVCRIKKYL